MKVIMSARKTIIKDQFRERVEKKMAKFNRFFGEDAQVAVTVGNERDRETVEITITHNGML
jgi:putative sigma-54 modulation protein